jgi:hypothetical protein
VKRFRRLYGAGPVHLAAMTGCTAVAAYALLKVLQESGTKGILFWFAVSVVGWDFIAWPLCAVVDRLAVRAYQRHQGRRPAAVPWINYIRVPTVISVVLLLLFFPLIFRLNNPYYQALTGFNENIYIVNWLVVTGALFAGSTLAYLVRLRLAGRQPPSRDRSDR